MKPTRRRIIVTMTGAVAATFAARPLFPYLNAQQNTAPLPNYRPSPNAPGNQNVPLGLDGSEIPVRGGDDREIPPASWTEIKSDAQKLLDLATDFKWQVQRANLNATLPLLLLQEAHSIEKLAKHVQERMKA
jgi:hypothetical protein